MTQAELWKPVPHARGYMASSDGRVRGPRGILRPSAMANGYLGIKMAGKGTTVHAAVALAFHGAPPTNKYTVNHKNGVKTDNTPGNLEWMTRKQNMRHAVEVLGVKFGGKPRLPPIEPDPEPLSVWQTVQVLDAHGAVMHAITLRVPTAGRCDQHAGEVDGVRCDALVTATDVGRLVAGMICKRATFAQRCEARQ